MDAVLGIILFLVTFCQAVTGDGHCVMRGRCGIDDYTGLSKPCVYNGTALPVKDEHSVKFLQEFCPFLNQDFGVCCDSIQIHELQVSVEALLTLFSRCPSCTHNIANLLCHLTCSPSQSNFLEVTDSTVKEKEGKEVVNSANYYVTEKFTEGLFNSCSKVKLPGTTENGIQIACGVHTTDCTPHRWLNYMGEHDPSPYEIDFHFAETDKVVIGKKVFYPMNATIIPCSHPVTPGGVACSCEDCECYP